MIALRSRKGIGVASRRRLVTRLAYPILAVGLLAQVIIPVARIATSYRSAEMGLSALEILLLSSTFSLLPIGVVVWIGRHNDRYGTRNSVLSGAVLLLVASLMLLLVPSSWLSLLIGTTILGLGMTLQLAGIQAEIGVFRHDRHRISMTQGLMVWQAIGQIAAPLLLSLVSLATPGRDVAESLFAWAVGLSVASIAFSLSIFAHAAVPRPGVLSKVPLLTILRVPGLLWICIAGSLCVAVQDAMVILMPLLGIERGIPVATVGLMLSIFAVGQIVARALYARAMVRMGNLTLMVLAVLLTGVGTALLAVPMYEMLVGAVLLVIGMGVGFSTGSSISLTMQLAPRGATSTSLSIRLAMNRTGQFAVLLLAGFAAAAMGTGGVLLLIGATAVGYSFMAPRNIEGLRRRSPNPSDWPID